MVHITMRDSRKKFSELTVSECFRIDDDENLYMKVYMEGPTKLVNAVSISTGKLRNFTTNLVVYPEHSFSYEFTEDLKR